MTLFTPLLTPGERGARDCRRSRRGRPDGLSPSRTVALGSTVRCNVKGLWRVAIKVEAKSLVDVSAIACSPAIFPCFLLDNNV